MTSYRRIKSSSWHKFLSLWPHLLPLSACPFCSCHTDLLPNSSLKNCAPNLDSAFAGLSASCAASSNDSDWPLHLISLSAQMSPHWERPALKNTTPASNHHSVSLPWFSFLLALRPYAPLHVCFSLIGHISSQNINFNIGKHFVMLTPRTVWHKRDT